MKNYTEWNVCVWEFDFEKWCSNPLNDNDDMQIMIDTLNFLVDILSKWIVFVLKCVKWARREIWIHFEFY